jgi:hypothetical protein
MMEVAEMMGRTRKHERARLYYERIADAARRDGREDIAALAELRRVLRHYPPYLRESAVRDILAKSDPKLRAPVLEGKLALARMAYEQKEEAKGDAIVAELAALKIRRPILVYSPPYDLGHSATDNLELPSATHGGVGGTFTPGEQGSAARFGAVSFSTSRTPLNVEDMWMDVAFTITPQGRVEGLKILRSKGSPSWAQPLLRSIQGRRYTPAVAGSKASVRRERYTYTSGLEPGSGTKAKRHSPNARVEYFDLTDISAVD